MKITRALPKIFSALFKPLAAPSAPENIQVDITTLCNLRCKMCPRYALEESERNRSLSMESYERVVSGAVPGSVNLAATGEPFLHSDFFKMVSHAGEKCGAVTMTSSNFTYVTKETIEKIAASGLDILKISIDSPDPETYRKIRGQEGLQKIKDNIAALNAAKKAARTAKPSIRIDFVVMKENFRQIRQMIKFASDAGAEGLFFRLLDTNRVSDGVKSELTAGFNADELIGEFKAAKEYAAGYGVKNNLDELLEEPEYVRLSCGEPSGGKLKRGVCLLPWLQMFVTVSGDASPCCSLYPSGRLEEGGVGNVLKDGFAQTWNGAKMRGLRRLFRDRKNYEVFRACRSCRPMDMKNLLRTVKLFPGIIKLK